MTGILFSKRHSGQAFAVLLEPFMADALMYTPDAATRTAIAFNERNETKHVFDFSPRERSGSIPDAINYLKFH